MQIVDMCEDKKDYKKIVKFCDKQKKSLYSALRLNENVSIYEEIKEVINDHLKVSSVIRNYDPGSANIRDKFPAEIMISIANKDDIGITTYGSGFLGGCNASEYGDFLELIHSGVKDFKYILNNKESEDEQ